MHFRKLKMSFCLMSLDTVDNKWFLQSLLPSKEIADSLKPFGFTLSGVFNTLLKLNSYFKSIIHYGPHSGRVVHAFALH